MREQLRYFWLCSTCSQSLTIQTSTAGGVRIAPARAVHETCQPTGERRDFADSSELNPSSKAAKHTDTRSGKHKLALLKKELEFLDSGGYRQALGWRAPFIFEDSPICPKPRFSSCPSVHCVLMDFVPREHRGQRIPCRHIALKPAGETLDTLYSTAAMEEIETSLRDWLKREITRLERAC